MSDSDEMEVSIVVTADITALLDPDDGSQPLIKTGTHSYTFGGFDRTSMPNRWNSPTGTYGANLVVVYESNSLPSVDLRLDWGVDAWHITHSHPQGPHAQIKCYEFPSTLAVDTDITFYVGVAESENNDHNLYYTYDSGSIPSSFSKHFIRLTARRSCKPSGTRKWSVRRVL